jgi:hypothetical protein
MNGPTLRVRRAPAPTTTARGPAATKGGSADDPGEIVRDFLADRAVQGCFAGSTTRDREYNESMGGEPDSSRPAPSSGRNQHTLAERLEIGGALDPGEVAALGATIAAELAELHQRGEVSGNICPESIVRAGDVDSGRVLRAGHYRAPEQFAGGPASASADVYSLGVVLLEALSARPLRPTGRAATMADFPDALSTVPTRLGRRWQWVLQGMTARSPNVRMTASLAAASLMDLERRSRRRPAAAVTVAAAGATAATSGEGRGQYSSGEPTSEVDAGHRTRLRRPVAVAAVGLVLVLSAGALTARLSSSGSGSDEGLVVVQELASSETTSTTVKRTTTTTTTTPGAPAAEVPLLVLDPNDTGEPVRVVGASLGRGSTRFRPVTFVLDGGDDGPDEFVFIPPTTFTPPPVFSVPPPTTTPPPTPPTTAGPPPTTRPPTTTAPPATTVPPTTAPPPPTTEPPPPPTTEPPPPPTTEPPPPPTTEPPPPPTTEPPPPPTTEPPPPTTDPPVLLPLPDLGFLF